jgi:hypothetical protein
LGTNARARAEPTADREFQIWRSLDSFTLPF